MEKKLNGFNNGRDTTDGIGGQKPFYDGVLNNMETTNKSAKIMMRVVSFRPDEVSTELIVRFEDAVKVAHEFSAQENQSITKDCQTLADLRKESLEENSKLFLENQLNLKRIEELEAEIERLKSKNHTLQLFVDGDTAVRNLKEVKIRDLESKIKDLKVVLKEASQTISWCQENLHLPHTSDHFNIPVNTINEIEQALTK